MAVRLILVSGVQRVLEEVDSAHLDDPFFLFALPEG
jgi:hypothetical protein